MRTPLYKQLIADAHARLWTEEVYNRSVNSPTTKHNHNYRLKLQPSTKKDTNELLSNSVNLRRGFVSGKHNR